MSEPVKPALSAEEWARWTESEARLGVVFTPVASPEKHMDGMFFESRFYVRRDASGFGDIPVLPEGADKRAAAIALDGQTFGFRWEDVKLLRGHVLESDAVRVMGPEDIAALYSLADRIEALLRPRKDET